MRVYATTADLAEWTGTTAPNNAESLLRSASLLVESATETAFYATDADGYPTKASVSTAFKDATTAQAAHWSANGLDPAAGAVKVTSEGAPTQKTIDGASVTYSVSLVEAGREARVAALSTLSPDAHRILDAESLLGTGPVLA